VQFDVALSVRALWRTRRYIASVWDRTRNIYAKTKLTKTAELTDVQRKKLALISAPNHPSESYL